MRRLLVPFAALVAGVSVALPAFLSASATAAHGVRTVVGAGTLDGPGGIALDAAGDLFVADTGHCRVVVVPTHSGTFEGVRVRLGQVATVAGGSCEGTASIGHPSGVGGNGTSRLQRRRSHRVRSGARPTDGGDGRRRG